MRVDMWGKKPMTREPVKCFPYTVCMAEKCPKIAVNTVIFFYPRERQLKDVQDTEKQPMCCENFQTILLIINYCRVIRLLSNNEKRFLHDC